MRPQLGASPQPVGTGLAPPVQLETKAEMKQAPKEVVIPSGTRTSAPLSRLREENLLFVRDFGDATSYIDGSGGSAGTVAGFGGIAGFGALAGLPVVAVLPTVKYLRIFSRRFGPMPRTARKIVHTLERAIQLAHLENLVCSD